MKTVAGVRGSASLVDRRCVLSSWALDKVPALRGCLTSLTKVGFRSWRVATPAPPAIPRLKFYHGLLASRFGLLRRGFIAAIDKKIFARRN